MDILWILFAFVCGLGVKLLGQPPLIGFLLAGFALNGVGVQGNATLSAVADVGITLMLFTIGLKLNVRDLLKREVLVGSIGHLAVWMLVATSTVLLLGALGVAWFVELDLRGALLIGLALSFSSTVCLVKLLEENGELATRHGRLSIGILVLQDIVAVVFLVVAAGKVPSPWAVLLVGLYFLRWPLGMVISRLGHGEMLPLAGVLLALGGYELFSAFGVKGDLGALVVGTLIASHPKASELAKSLLGFKDLFLVGFFLTIGLEGLPSVSMLGVALALCLLLPVKVALFFGLLTRLGLRARTSYLSGLALGNYSEFGLIVMLVCVDKAWLGSDWLVVVAIALSLSFVATSALYRVSHRLYAQHRDVLRRFEKPERLPEDQVYRPVEAEILVIGTGRVGMGAFRAMHAVVGDRVWGMDADRSRVARLREAGMNVFAGDGESADAWEALGVDSIQLVLLAVTSVQDASNITEQLKLAGYRGRIAAIARYEDEREALSSYGVDKVFNFYSEAGSAFAEDSLRLIEAGSPRP